MRKTCIILVLLTAGCHPVSYDPAGLPVFLREDQTSFVPPPGCDSGVVRPEQKPELSLPDAIEATVFSNLRIQAGREKVQQARADLITDSLIPNAQLLIDGQLLPLQ